MIKKQGLLFFPLVNGLHFRLKMGLIFTFWSLYLTCPNPVIASEDSRQIELIETYKRGNYQRVLELEAELVISPNSTLWLYIASAYVKVGKLDKAIKIYEDLISQTRKAESKSSLLTDLAQLLVSTGKLEQAHVLTQEVLTLTQSSEKKAIIHGIQGNIFLRLGKYKQAISSYQIASENLEGSALLTAFNNLSVAYERWANKLEEDAAWVNRWGEVETTKQLKAQAIEARQKRQDALKNALDLSKTVGGVEAIRALQMAKHIEVKTGKNSSQILSMISALPDSRTKGDLFLSSDNPEMARQVAYRLGDLRLLSFALGELGKQALQNNNLSLALTRFLQAQQAALQVGAWDSLYLWQWELAKIYHQKGDKDQAIAAYLKAIETLNRFRQDLALIRSQLEFTQNVEPVYREALSLLLEGDISSSHLNIAQTILKQYQLALVENYFHSPCPIEIQPIPSKEQTVVINIISLKQSTHLLLQRPDGGLNHYKLNLKQSELEQLAIDWRLQLKNFVSEDYLKTAQILHKNLIAPLESTLKSQKIKTVVIVPDGPLQSLPFAALFDGQQFLIEKYNIAFSLGLHHQTDKILKQKGGVTFGLSSSVAGLQPLPGVLSEVNAVAEFTNTQPFLNEVFTFDNLQKVLQTDQPLVHLATHGRFGGSAEQTWLQAFDGKISLFELESLLLSTDNPINLLFLSGCETAVGNTRSILGAGGLALRAGVHNVISSLWRVDDFESTDLIIAFYKYYQLGLSPESALRQAQLNLLEKSRNHPSQWAGFVVISN